MSNRVARAALRAVAIAIAIAALIDPVMTLARTAPPLVVAHMASSDVAPSVEALRAALPNGGVTVRLVTDRRLPCTPGEPCVIVADGSIDVELPDDMRGPVSMIRVRPAAGSNVAIRSVVAPQVQHAAAAGSVHVAISGAGIQGRRTELRVTDGAAIVGSVIHEWTSDGDAAIDIPWWPIAEGPRALRVEAVPLDGEVTAVDNVVDVGVMVSSRREHVLIVDARPSWASAFVRRALEDDARFRVEHRVSLGPTLAAGTAGGRLDAPTLDAVSVVIVGGAEDLGSGDVTLIERFVRTRGGTLILLPDRVPSGAAARLFMGRWTEHVEALASPIGPLRASETIRLAEASPADVVLGSVKGSPAIVVSPTGNGRIVVSGAMDAWRYRDVDRGAFDRFWRSVVLEMAAASAPLSVHFALPIGAPGADLPFEVRHRRMGASVSQALTATASCGERPAQVIRLWPKGPQGVFAGRVSVDSTQGCEVTATVAGGPVATSGFAATGGAIRSLDAVLAKLERFAEGSGGVVVSAGEEDSVAAAMRSAISASESPPPVYPMRSPWWLMPFAACLSVEWWLRRGLGLR